MTSTTLDQRTLQGRGRAWVAAPRRAPAVEPLAALDQRRLLAVFAAAVAATLLVMFVLGLLAAPGGDPASASGGEPANPVPAARVHVAAPGDSLWSIADDHHGDVAFGRYLDTLIRLNGGTTIHAGQAVELP